MNFICYNLNCFFTFAGFAGFAAFAGLRVEAMIGGGLICNRTAAIHHNVGSEFVFLFLRKCFVSIVLFLFAAQNIAYGDTAPTPTATPTPTTTSEQPASSQVSGEDDAKNSKPPAVKYVRFLDVLPEALDMDDNVRNASLSLRAAVESAKASRSGWFPKADITLNAARQKDIKAGAGAGTDTTIQTKPSSK